MRPSFYMRKYWVKPGKKRPLCIRVHRKAPSWARSSCNAFLSGKLWQYFVAVHPRRGPGQEKRPFAARYRRHASKMSWFWQDSRAVYPNSPANRRSVIHRAEILPLRGVISVRGLLENTWRSLIAMVRHCRMHCAPFDSRLARRCSAERRRGRKTLAPRVRPATMTAASAGNRGPVEQRRRCPPEVASLLGGIGAIR